MRPNRDKLGDGSSPHSLFPCWHLARIGCQLPDAILHGKRSHRPHSRAVQRLAVAEFRVRHLSSLRLAFADAGWRTRQRHVCDFSIRVFTDKHQDSRCFWQRVGLLPRVLPLNSQVAFRSQASGALLASQAFWKVSQACLPDPPRNACSFCLAFRRLSFGRFCPNRQSHPLRAGAQ